MDSTGLPLFDLGWLLAGAFRLLPTFVTLLAGAAMLFGADRILLHRARGRGGENRFGRQIVMIVLTVVVAVMVILALPVSETTRGQLLSLLGLAVTAAITLSSATFVGNVMAGLMLRSVGNMRPGDYVHVGEHFGRVTIRGLFHTEIQTTDRDLTTLPNMYLVSNPVTVVRESGTIVSCEVSLGYDNQHDDVERPLLAAANGAGLADAFVHVTRLGDYSVSYRVSGFLADLRTLLSTRSELRKHVLDELHEAGIEILSPAFMAQRPLPPDARIVPDGGRGRRPSTSTAAKAEELAFDKAEVAERIEKKKQDLRELRTRVDTLQEQLGAAATDATEAVAAEIEAARAEIRELEQELSTEDNGKRES